MTTALTELIDERTILYPLTIEQYHWMITHGIMPEGEPYELLDGHLVRKDRSAVGEDPMTVGHDHTFVVQFLERLDRRLEPRGCHMRCQQPVSLPPYDEPEPDGAIIRGQWDDYRKRHPGAKDVLCVIEVADASLKRDRTTKLRIYATAGIPTYLIINLPERCVEVYTQPRRRAGRYGRPTVLPPEQEVEFPTAAGEPLRVAVKELLP
jgi:Uma2 family endonuclease